MLDDDRDVAPGEVPGRARAPRWPDVVVAVAVTLAAMGVLYALTRMDWARRVSLVGGTETFSDGPTTLLAFAAVASVGLSLLVVLARRRWLRWMLFAAALTTTAAAITTALVRIATANTVNQPLGFTVTSYEPGAAVGVVSAVVMAVVTLVGLLTSYAPSISHTQPEAQPSPATP